MSIFFLFTIVIIVKMICIWNVLVKFTFLHLPRFVIFCSRIVFTSKCITYVLKQFHQNQQFKLLLMYLNVYICIRISNPQFYDSFLIHLNVYWCIFLMNIIVFQVRCILIHWLIWVIKVSGTTWKYFGGLKW